MKKWPKMCKKAQILRFFATFIKSGYKYYKKMYV